MATFEKGHVPWNKGKQYDCGGWVILTCEFCGNDYRQQRYRKNKSRFCCHKCFTDWRKETGAIRGNNHPSWGKERPDVKGEKNHNWNGGTSKENKNRWSDNNYLHWRRGVFHRDNYTCQECGKRGCYLEAHHIKSWSEYPELRYIINNGITYCRECHAEIDDRRYL